MFVQFFKFTFAISKLFYPSADNVSVQPSLRGFKTLETPDAFKPGLKVGVVALNNVGGVGAVFEMKVTKQVFLPRFDRCYDVLQRPVVAAAVMEYVH